MAEGVGLTQDGGPVWERLKVVPSPSWKEVFPPFREINVSPHLWDISREPSFRPWNKAGLPQTFLAICDESLSGHEARPSLSLVHGPRSPGTFSKRDNRGEVLEHHTSGASDSRIHSSDPGDRKAATGRYNNAKQTRTRASQQATHTYHRMEPTGPADVP